MIINPQFNQPTFKIPVNIRWVEATQQWHIKHPLKPIHVQEIMLYQCTMFYENVIPALGIDHKAETNLVLITLTKFTDINLMLRQVIENRKVFENKRSAQGESKIS